MSKQILSFNGNKDVLVITESILRKLLKNKLLFPLELEFTTFSYCLDNDKIKVKLDDNERVIIINVIFCSNGNFLFKHKNNDLSSIVFKTLSTSTTILY